MAIDGRHEGMSRRLTSSFRRALFPSNQWAIDLRKAEQAMGTNTCVGDPPPPVPLRGPKGCPLKIFKDRGLKVNKVLFHCSIH